MGQDPCISTIQLASPDQILAQCSLSETKRRNTLVRLSDSLIYFDQNDTIASHKCELSHQFKLNGQGIFRISPTCTLQVGNSYFTNKNTYTTDKGHSMITNLAKVIFSHMDATRFPDVFRDMQPQYLRLNWAVIGRTIIFFLTLAGIACLLYTSPSPRD